MSLSLLWTELDFVFWPVVSAQPITTNSVVDQYSNKAIQAARHRGFLPKEKAWNTTSSVRSDTVTSDFTKPFGRETRTSFPSNNAYAACRSWRKSAIRYIAHAQRNAALYSPFPSLSAALHYNYLPCIELTNQCSRMKLDDRRSNQEALYIIVRMADVT